ncbi:hypothetical protein [Streptomyces thermodiastaticus]|uniref:hypothetical protein n=1 Tax=Streptomyces thermodiastaticus TaxID=44061 RepID=UPI001678EF74|nr:hypothetical protein [Streptomyces thermodiastaticus]MCE7550891.1 hypothetical protein [Streptomyces thermodiastaticus]GHF74029.1 hypothetical protein GCM10018787_23410 [Streptomyces thermodiastaticus]
MSAEELEPGGSPAAGGCVLVTLGGGALAAVFAASEEAGVLTVWALAAAALWWSARRWKGTDQPLPSPTAPPSRGDVYAGETGEVARVVHSPEGVMCIVHPVREEVSGE